jgi:asparagine N-glycosylation enzyme membrane subunit Stt3
MTMEIAMRKLIGHQIVVIGPSFVDNDKLQSIKLLAVEEAGIWIESQEAAEKTIGRLQKKPSTSALAFFIPFAQISSIVAGFDPSAIE